MCDEILFYKKRWWEWHQWKYWRKNYAVVLEGLKLVWGLEMSELCKAAVYIIELHYTLNQFPIPNIAVYIEWFILLVQPNEMAGY